MTQGRSVWLQNQHSFFTLLQPLANQLMRPVAGRSHISIPS